MNDTSFIGRYRFVRVARAAVRLSPFLLPLCLLFASGLAWAVAGGAGGSSSSDSDWGTGGSSSDGALLELVFWIIFYVPFPYNLIALAILAIAAWYGRKSIRTSSGLNRIPSVPLAPPRNLALPERFVSRNPGFSPASLINKASTAFTTIQQAWTKQDMAPARRWLSDGIWQRFNTQFTMMRLLDQKNLVSNVRVRKVYIAGIEEDGAFDIAHVGIYYTAEDDFVSGKFPQLNQCGPVEMLEYWSFVRKAGVAEKDMYHSNNCPSCGAGLPTDMGEVARCANCHTICSLGDYDWVLSEITQADDFVNSNTRLTKSGNFTQRIRSALAADDDFSIQSIEDKASNAYMQIMAAQVTRQPVRMRRFVGDEAFASLSQCYAAQAPFVFNRLYLNNVTVMDYFRADGKDNIVIALKRTAQRVGLVGERLVPIDSALYASNEVVILTRDVDAVSIANSAADAAGTARTAVAKGSLYAHACPACGAPVGDTLDIKCAYCGEVLNSTRREWIVTALLAADAYASLAASRKSELITGVELSQLDPLYAARDYVFNNVLMMIGIDGEITPDELTFARQLARSMGYDEAKLGGMFELAKNRQLVLRLPENRKTAIRVRQLMEKAARADHVLSAVEQTLLNEVSLRINTLAA